MSYFDLADMILSDLFREISSYAIFDINYFSLADRFDLIRMMFLFGLFKAHVWVLCLILFLGVLEFA